MKKIILHLESKEWKAIIYFSEKECRSSRRQIEDELKRHKKISDSLFLRKLLDTLTLILAVITTLWQIIKILAEFLTRLNGRM